VPDSTSDEILMAAYQAGNHAAFAELFERHSGSVYGFSRAQTPDRSLAEDLYQEAFLRLHRRATATTLAGHFEPGFLRSCTTCFGTRFANALEFLRPSLFMRSAHSADEETSGEVLGHQVSAEERSPEELVCARESTGH
jgi:RNA polymerase sigma-70 factor (ECF subfamily)